jgi:hypothetical protein
MVSMKLQATKAAEARAAKGKVSRVLKRCSVDLSRQVASAVDHHFIFQLLLYV